MSGVCSHRTLLTTTEAEGHAFTRATHRHLNQIGQGFSPAIKRVRRTRMWLAGVERQPRNDSNSNPVIHTDRSMRLLRLSLHGDEHGNRGRLTPKHGYSNQHGP